MKKCKIDKSKGETLPPWNKWKECTLEEEQEVRNKIAEISSLKK